MSGGVGLFAGSFLFLWPCKDCSHIPSRWQHKRKSGWEGHTHINPWQDPVGSGKVLWPDRFVSYRFFSRGISGHENDIFSEVLQKALLFQLE